MAGSEHKGEAIYPDIKFSGRNLHCVCCVNIEIFIHQIQNFLTNNFNATEANYLYLVYPVVGIFLAGWFVRNIVKDDISHGVTKILYAISRRQGRIKRHNIWSSTIASAITIGFGGSVGAEAPIVLTGSAIGSNLGSVFKMEHRTLMLLVGCGAAGAIAGILKLRLRDWYLPWKC